ncbi:hypothetical protein [uncultured Nitratireductor sp.]|uniref:hypothetical protein n=1 Tax=uncultured Nitratireductor sp. TaxID=520953 RepID=UPI0025FC589B|nr:hypothetical protein [uncultured Nitratireductor sp.]
MKSDLIDLRVRAKHMTERAILVTTDDENEAWLPFSLVDLRTTGRVNEYDVTLPEQLAIEKGLV